MPDAEVKSHSDAWINQDAQHKNWGKGNRLWVRGPGTGHQRQSFIGFAKPFPNNDRLVVVAATLTLRVKDDWSGSHNVTVTRVTDTWKEHRITWANAPNTTTKNQAVENVTNASDGDKVEIDVTDILGDISLGDDWYGVRLELDDDVPRTFYASDAPKHVYHPRLEVEWGFAPYPPTDLDPAGNQVIGTALPVLTWRFPDIVQENTQAASQVQISTTTSFTSPAYNSGKQANTVHRWPMAGEGYPIPDDAYRYWRVQTWDDQGRPSGWSDVAAFERVSKGIITFVNPGPSGTVDDHSPTISWTFTGEQERVRLILWEVLPDKTTRNRWDSGSHKHTADHLTIPARKKHPIIKNGHDYRLELRIWDDEDRVGISNDKAYAVAVIDFVYNRSGVPNPVLSLTGGISPFAEPAVLLQWHRNTTPDWFGLRINDVISQHRIDPTDVAVVGGPAGDYQMLVWEATPGEASTYEIEAVEINGDSAQHSSGNQVVTVTTNPTGVWVIDDDYDEAVFMRGAESPDLIIGESGTTYDLVANPVPVRIVDAIRGYEGSWSGFLLTDAARLTLLELKGRAKELRIVIGNLNLPIYLEEIGISPSSQVPSRAMYEITLNFFQSGAYGEIDSEYS